MQRNNLLDTMLWEISGGQPNLLSGGQRHMIEAAAKIAHEYYKPVLETLMRKDKDAN